MVKLLWHTEKRRISDLLPYPKNPRKISQKQLNDLKKSLEKFDLVEIPAIDIDNTILAGHQRINLLSIIGRSDELIDVRVPNRKLTDEEFREYNIRSNKNTAGWDNDLLSEYFDFNELQDFGFTDKELCGRTFGKVFSNNQEEETEIKIDFPITVIANQEEFDLFERIKEKLNSKSDKGAFKKLLDFYKERELKDGD